jgi:hypothetical protein
MRLWRYCLAGFLFNWLVFVFWFVVPVRAVGFKATSTELALLQTASTVFYVLNSLFIGGLSDVSARCWREAPRGPSWRARSTVFVGLPHAALPWLPARDRGGVF